MPEVAKFKDRKFACVLYPETNPNHVEVLDKIRQSYDYAAILHDKDSDENGELKGAHYHVLFKFPAARYNSAVAEEIGLEINLLHKVRNIESYARYLVHADEPDKYKYSVDDVEGTLKAFVAKAVAGADCEDVRILKLLELLDGIDYRISTTAFVRLAAEHGMYAEVRRAGYLMRSILEEHNVQVVERTIDERAKEDMGRLAGTGIDVT